MGVTRSRDGCALESFGILDGEWVGDGSRRERRWTAPAGEGPHSNRSSAPPPTVNSLTLLATEARPVMDAAKLACRGTRTRGRTSSPCSQGARSCTTAHTPPRATPAPRPHPAPNTNTHPRATVSCHPQRGAAWLRPCVVSTAAAAQYDEREARVAAARRIASAARNRRPRAAGIWGGAQRSAPRAGRGAPPLTTTPGSRGTTLLRAAGVDGRHNAEKARGVVHDAATKKEQHLYALRNCAYASTRSSRTRYAACCER